MAEVRVIIQIEDEDLELVDGVVHLINKENLELLHRSETINGKAVFVIDDTKSYVVTSITENYYGTNTVIDTPIHNAVYAATVTTKSLTPPSNSNMCVITARAIDSIGKVAKSFYIKINILEGTIIEEENAIFNTMSFIKPDKDGYIQFEVFKNKKYQLLINSSYEYGQQELFTVNIPNKDHANLSDILFPKVSSIVFNNELNSSGDYDLTLNLSDGSQQDKYEEVIKLLSIVSDVDVELQKKDDDTTNLRVGVTQNGFIEFYYKMPGFSYPGRSWGNSTDSFNRSLITRYEF